MKVVNVLDLFYREIYRVPFYQSKVVPQEKLKDNQSMAKRSTRKFEAFVMHAHHDTPATYTNLFQKLAQLQPEDRIYRFSEEVIVGFPIVLEDAGIFFVQAVQGSDNSALVLNTETGVTRENILRRAEILSHATHFVAAPKKRRVVIEYVQRGAKADMLAAAIEGVLRSSYPELGNVGFSLAPVIKENFITEINAFARIREASIRVMRPNASWTDHYTELSDLAETSNGEKVAIEIKAGRGDTLKKNAGIVRVIKDVVSDHEPYLDDATVKGVRENETAETTIHANKHVLHTKASVEIDDAGVPIANDIRTKLTRFLASVLGSS